MLSEIMKKHDEGKVRGYFNKNNTSIDEMFKDKRTNLAYIVAGTGSGKSFWVKHELSKTGRILFVTSRKAKVLQDKDEAKNKRSFVSDFNGDSNIVCTNYALYCHIKELCSNTSKEEGIKNIDAFINGFDYIVFDEFHSFVCDSLFSREVFNIAVFCAYCAIKKKKKTILLSATIEPVEFFIKALSQIFKDMPDVNGIVQLDLTKECDYVLPEKIRVIDKNKSKNREICKLLDSGEKIMYFMNFVGTENKGNAQEEGVEGEGVKKKRKNYGYTIQQEYEFLLKYGLKEEEIAVIVSSKAQKKWDEEHKCEKACESSKKDENGKPIPITFNEWVREQIVETKEIPDGIRVLLCSATLNEGISIANESEDHFKYIITDAHYIATLIQQMGRLRNNLKEFWVINNARQHCNSYDDIEVKLVCLKFQSGPLFLEILTEYAERLKDHKEREEFIYWVKKKKGFDLVEYSYLTHRFEFNNLRYSMVNQINRAEEEKKNSKFKNLRIWQDELGEFANEHGVVFESSNYDRINKELQEKAEIKKHINSVLGNRFYKETWDKEKEFLRNLGLGVQPKKVNKTLKELDIHFELKKSDTVKKGYSTFWFESY